MEANDFMTLAFPLRCLRDVDVRRAQWWWVEEKQVPKTLAHRSTHTHLIALAAGNIADHIKIFNVENAPCGAIAMQLLLLHQI